MTRDELMQIHRIQNENHARTRELQWKFNIAIWTFMTAAIYFVTDNIMDIGRCWKGFVFTVFLIAEFLFAWLTQISLCASRLISNKIENELRYNKSNYFINIPTEANKAKSEVWKDWKSVVWIAFQLLITLGLGVILMFMMG